MKLKKLIEDLGLKTYGLKDVEITGLCAHSKFVAPGNLFIAKKGLKDDGARYIEEAVANGAVAILSDFFNPFLKDVCQLVHPQIQQLEAKLAAKYYGDPSHELFLMGVTGTNGKTTITYLIRHLLQQLHVECGLIGTIEYIIGAFHFEAKQTTPDILTNQKLLREMARGKSKAAVMEVSSHGLAQARVSQLDFDVAIFSNLSQDHLDYHETMDSYATEKAKLFSMLKENRLAIVNLESPWTEKMLKNCKANSLTYGFSKAADLWACDITLFPDATEFSVCYRGKHKAKFRWNLIGTFNVLNCLAAIGACLSYGIALEELPPHVGTFKTAPGRLESVDNLAGLKIFVDYAHKPGALENVLNCLKGLKKSRILTVFGCGGDRDKTKRKLMGEIAGQLSDFTWVTSDNPRSEDPLTICQEIARGFRAQNYAIEPDRRCAIEKALKEATKDDLILIAGKGHETQQIFSHQTLTFDDRKIAQEIANRLKS